VSQEKTRKIALNIGGMSCINCARTIEKALNKLNGVTHATVNLAAEKALIDYNPDIVDQKTLEDTITEVGYQVIHEKISIQVGGMTCINCAKTIEKALNAKEGIYNAVVNFATERVLVEYNSEQISLEHRRCGRKSAAAPYPTTKIALSRKYHINYPHYGFDVASTSANGAKQPLNVSSSNASSICRRLDVLRRRIQGLA
jgi:copper ion binding protein